MSTQTFTTVGSGSYTKPRHITKLLVECWGGGGSAFGNQTQNGTGGAGGQYAKKVIYYSDQELTIPYIVAAGGSEIDVGDGVMEGTAGGDSIWENTLVVAKGGGAGIVGAASGITYRTGSITGGIGDVVYAGGAGIVLGNSSFRTGAGGGGAGSTGNGNDATITNPGNLTTARGIGGVAKDENGGAGGDGVNATGVQDGKSGSLYGGGGAQGTSGFPSPGLLGLGAQGLIRITEFKEIEFSIGKDFTSPTIINNIVGSNQFILV
jgi:hypothetical protein